MPVGDGDRWYSARQVHERSGYALNTLRWWRSRGGGPPFQRNERGTAVYPVDAFEAWMKGKGK